MENFSPLSVIQKKIIQRASSAVARIQPFTIFVSCVGILLAYLTGMYASGSIHSASRWMGAILSCTSVITVLQMPSYEESIRPSIMRVVGTFLGAVIAYIYLRLLPFSVVGMLCAVFALEALCMLLDIYRYGRIATITMV
ncbi:MAG: FUSC family protein, partial [Alistipes sp.]|nr:FUSC family protein [Alistipes sp.]